MRRVVVVTTGDIGDSGYFMEDKLDGCLSSTINGVSIPRLVKY